MMGRTWMKWAPVGALGGALGLALLLTASAGATPTAQLRHAATADPLSPPPQMRSLYPMLGSYKCDDHPSAGAKPTVLYLTNTKGLGGHYLDSYTEIRPDVLHGRSTIGWDPVSGKYFIFYEDDWGSSYTETSPGWNNGHLIFSGSGDQVISPNSTGSAPGILLDLANDYQILGQGHFTDTQTVTVPGGQSVQHNYDCRRL